MKKEFSPEEKLLRLIKGAKKKASSPEPEGDILRAEKTAPSLPAPAERIPAALPESAQAGPPHAGASQAAPFSFSFTMPEFNTGVLNAILTSVLACLLLYLVYDLFSTAHAPDSLEEFAQYEVSEAGETPALARQEEPYSYYAGPAQGRSIFTPQEIETTAPVQTGPSVEEISAGFSLIGIIAGDRPQAIVEDKKTGKSYFVYTNGAIGQVRVVEIRSDSVIMEYQGKRFELIL